MNGSDKLCVKRRRHTYVTTDCCHTTSIVTFVLRMKIFSFIRSLITCYIPMYIFLYAICHIFTYVMWTVNTILSAIYYYYYLLIFIIL